MIGSTVASRFRESVNYRDLLFHLVIRDLKVRYRQSFLGFLWSLLNPLMMMAVFTVVFTVLMPNGTIHAYPAFLLSALLPWNWCAFSVVAATVSIIGNGHLITKVYFPREILPISIVLSNGVNFMFALIVLFAVLLVFGLPPSTQLVFLPIVMAIQIIFLSGLALFLSAVNVFFRDTEVIVEVVVNAWFFLTPVFYDIGQVLPAYAKYVYWLNPMASLIVSYRLIFYYHANPDPAFLLRTLLTSTIVLVIGYMTFIRLSRRFGEEL